MNFIITSLGDETVIKNVFTAQSETKQFAITVDRGKLVFINIELDKQEIYADLIKNQVNSLFIGISSQVADNYFRTVEIKDLSKTHRADHDLMID